jgi:hypothetical protein
MPRSFCNGVTLRRGRNVTASPWRVRSRVSPGKSQIESIAREESQFVPQVLGQNHPASPINSYTAAHNAIMYWFEPHLNWYLL